MSRSFDCYVQGCLLFQFVDGNEKNVTIRRDDLKATEQNYPVVLWNVVLTFESFESI